MTLYQHISIPVQTQCAPTPSSSLLALVMLGRAAGGGALTPGAAVRHSKSAANYRRTNLQPSLPTSPSLTHTQTNTIPRDSWSISRDSTTPLGSLCVHRPCQGCTHNPTGLPVRSQGCTCNPTGLPVHSQGCALTQTSNQDAPHNFSHPSRVLCFYAI